MLCFHTAGPPTLPGGLLTTMRPALSWRAWLSATGSVAQRTQRSHRVRLAAFRVPATALLVNQAARLLVTCAVRRAHTAAVVAPQPLEAAAAPVSRAAFSSAMQECLEGKPEAFLHHGARAVIALSGGPDSVALSLLLQEWCATHGVALRTSRVVGLPD
ncbi:hypothetical protein EON67_07320 [archaeon]|nr:MAG: hypothetical protein EON67_07320 [archaeon]